MNADTDRGPERRLLRLREDAQTYNRKLLATGDNSDYLDQLDPVGNGVMGRIKIPKIEVDLPIFHTANDDVLRKGAGHMEETTLPVGGIPSHAAITAHRGLAESRLFTDLDQLGVGDRFTLEVAGEVLTYEVETTRIVAPTETEWLLVDSHRDLVTLITCDPLGINSERMLVTGHRLSPTPLEDLESAGQPSSQPSFPWWMMVAGAGTIGKFVAVRWARRPIKEGQLRNQS